MSFQKTAEQLLVLADEIDKDAAEVTEFVCDKCNHTATLAAINGKRAETAKELGKTASAVTVNDKIHCPACDGIMSYKVTAASESYYFDPDRKAAKKDEPKDDDAAEACMEEAKKRDDDDGADAEAKKQASQDYDA